MAYRLAHLGRAVRYSVLQQHQRRSQSSLQEFLKQVKTEIDSNPELKNSVSELRQQAEALKQRTRTATNGLSKAAQAAAQQASQVTARMQEQAAKATQDVQGAMKSSVESMQSTIRQASPAASDTFHKDSSSSAGGSASSGTDTGPSTSHGSAGKEAAPVEHPGSFAAGAAADAEPGPSMPPAGGSDAGASRAARAAGCDSTTGSTGPFVGTSAEGAESAEQASQQQATGTGSGAGTTDQEQSTAFGGAAGTSGQAKAQGGSLLERVTRLASVVRDEVANAVLPQQQTESATKARKKAPAAKPDAWEGPTALATVPETRWQRQWRQMSEKLGGHPLFRRLAGWRNNPVVAKGQDLVEEARTRWETSDSAFVNRVQDMKENMFTETEAALSLKEIRARDPNFDMVLFLRHLKVDVPVVIRAYLQGKVDILKEHCSPEMVERLTGIIAAQQAQGVFPDSTILDVSDVELVDLKFVGDDPVVVAQFNCQQINCGRDKFGNVVEGGPSEVQRWYYYWALQQEPAGFVGTDGKAYPPRWQLSEMMVRGMHHLL